MGRRSVVKDLPEDELNLVIDGLTGAGEFKGIGALTDREICLAYNKKFNKKLSKSSLARWRQSIGDEIADKVMIARRQARQLLEDLGEDKDADKFQIVISNIEDRLLTATREVIAADPVKMLQISLDEQKRRLKVRELDLKERQMNLELAKAKAVDPAAMPAQVLEQLLEFIGDDTAGLRWFRSNSEKLEQFLVGQYTA